MRARLLRLNGRAAEYTVLLLLHLNEHLLDHLRVRKLYVICPAVDELVDQARVHVFLALSDHLHGDLHELKKLLGLVVATRRVRAHERRLKVLD